MRHCGMLRAEERAEPRPSEPSTCCPHACCHAESRMQHTSGMIRPQPCMRLQHAPQHGAVRQRPSKDLSASEMRPCKCSNGAGLAKWHAAACCPKPLPRHRHRGLRTWCGRTSKRATCSAGRSSQTPVPAAPDALHRGEELRPRRLLLLTRCPQRGSCTLLLWPCAAAAVLQLDALVLGPKAS